MRFRYDPLSRVFSNRCVFDENAQRGSVDGRHNASKSIGFSGRGLRITTNDIQAIEDIFRVCIRSLI